MNIGISQAIKIICEYTGNNIDEIIFCLVNDLKIPKEICEEEKGIGLDKLPSVSEMLNNNNIHPAQQYKYYTTDGKKYLQNLIPTLTPIDKASICSFAFLLIRDGFIKHTDMNKIKSKNKKDTPSQIIINNENTNSANANASNENIITISTLSQLSNQVSQSTTIENKIEIQKLISQLEDAKDEGNEESYFDLFFKLLDKLSGSGLIPDWLAKSAKFAQKFINK